MEQVVHRASERGFANHGWLKAAHSFSFANYHNRDKMHFGLMRVLNDDIVASSRGFDMHPHQDMEIITIPLKGALRHKDNMGNEGVIAAGEVQVMSAGTGVLHSEFNASDTEDVNLFQIWIFPDKQGHRPRYDQKKFSVDGRKKNWQLLVSPDGQNESLSINQDAFISTLDSEDLENTKYEIKSEANGVYFMVIEGSASIEGNNLEKRDAAGFWNCDKFVEIQLNKSSGILAIEVPMH